MEGGKAMVAPPLKRNEMVGKRYEAEDQGMLKRGMWRGWWGRRWGTPMKGQETEGTRKEFRGSERPGNAETR